MLQKPIGDGGSARALAQALSRVHGINEINFASRTGLSREGEHRRTGVMKLRDHPLIAYRGFRTWPPMWIQVDGSVETLFGEIGVLAGAYLSREPLSQCHLLVDYEGKRFAAALPFDNPKFCSQICNVLQANLGRSIKDIADMDLSFTL